MEFSKHSVSGTSLLLSPEKQKLVPWGPKKRVIVIAGPTASGKTHLSLLLAQAIGGEILSADSCQVYRGMDIGTAKASPEDRALIHHHLIDICDLQETFNAAEFYKAAQEAIKEICLRESVPIIAGGSGFYLHALLYGPPSGPASLPEVRAQLERQMLDLGVEVLYERLQMLDPVYAATISEYDRHKIIRGLEIIAISDKRVSDFPKPNELQEQNYDYRCWFIYYPREQLYSRIDARCEEMVRRGLIDEVKELEKKGLKQNLSAAQAIGYRQALAFLDSPQTDTDRGHFLDEFKKASRRYAKRQFTWFRKEPQFRWLNIVEFDPERLKELILQDFEQNP